ncbi:3-hydroxyisobutyrate dehydrogenase [Roseovarius azorensis]|uniref:L-threonate dehydrogenase n=1 Tax=Roseovarius azorensis TaxID=1287727 RepID=A0A1H7X300_9RHOB|nr:L-threonate dehydrogenase [Roseovarius azorensis]SEM28240.1 3-hydroxyisobutyrate dehydrogenase [Roseovarius azorensis]
MSKVGFIGLGSMGYGMAVSVLKAGHDVWGHDVNVTVVDRFRDQGGQPEALFDAAPMLDALVVVVLNATQTETVLSGPDGMMSRLRERAVILSCATVPPAFARRIDIEARTRGLLYLDAPISGGAAKAAQGKLTMMASGQPEAFAAARPVLDAMAAKVFELGDTAGAGSAMKAANQMLAGIHIAAMGEALTFGMTQGIAPATFLDVISQSAGTSWMLENRAPHVVAGDYTPQSAINIWPKDLGIVLDIAREAYFGAPLAAAAMQQFLAAAGMGLGAEDDAAVAKVYARNAGLTLPGQGS